MDFVWVCFCLFWSDCCFRKNSLLISFQYTGAVELAAVGVSASVFNLVSKVFNVPLLNITTSFVAEEQALIGKEEDSGGTEENGMKIFLNGFTVFFGRMSSFPGYGYRFSWSNISTDSFGLM